MKSVLVIGSGAREHALCWKLAQSKLVQKVYCAPGNPGIAACAELVPLAVTKLSELAEFAKQKQISLTVVGPEVPLSLGIVDVFTKQQLPIFGPTQAAARLEASKQFAKEVMTAAGVPTAKYTSLTSRLEAEKFIAALRGPIVLKADGLAAGKGVVVCKNPEEAREALPLLFDELKAEVVVAEEFLEGLEASLIVAANGELIVPLVSTHDYKRIADNDEGPNTGGMGSVSPTSHLSAQQEAWAIEHVIRPMLQEMKRRGQPFMGFLYAGLMISPQGQVHVLEFNTRLGDPETQSIMRRLDSDLFQVLQGLLASEPPQVSWSPLATVCVVLAADGYPQSPKLGAPITGLEFASQIPSVQVFHAGTELKAGSLCVAGGRVLSVTAQGSTIDEARGQAYRAVDMIQFKNRQVRRDIGMR